MREQLGIAFSKRAKDLLEEEAEAPMLSTISGLMLLGTYHASVARQNLGFIYAGIGLRLVQAREWDCGMSTDGSGLGDELLLLGQQWQHHRRDKASAI